MVVADLREGKTAEVAEAINEAGGHALAMGVNVAEADDVERMVADTVQTVGGIDVVFSNAGTLRPGNAEELSVDAWDLVMAVNVRSVFLGAKFAVPAMRERGGSIINTASISGLHGDGGAICYAASKAAVINLTRAPIDGLCPGGDSGQCDLPGDHRDTTDRPDDGLPPAPSNKR